MTRRETIQYLNEKVYPLFDSRYTGWTEPKDIIRAIEKYKRGKQKNIQMIPKNVNGCLFIDGEFIIRVEYLIKPFAYSEKQEYFEGKCINDV